MSTLVGERGQITIPKPIRDRLGITPGMALEVHEEGGTILIRKPGIGAALERWAGVAENPYGDTDRFISAVRDGR